MNDQKSLLPWYINESLPVKERDTVTQWLETDPEAKKWETFTRNFAAAVTNQDEAMPSTQVEMRLLNRLYASERPSPISIRWAWSIPFALLLFAILWIFIQPGTELAWTANSSELTAFRIYRSAGGSNGYELVEEIPVNDLQGRYQFSDNRLIPGLTYSYIIEGVTENGNSVRTSALTIQTISTFAAQFAILLTSFVLTFGMITITKELKKSVQINKFKFS